MWIVALFAEDDNRALQKDSGASPQGDRRAPIRMSRRWPGLGVLFVPSFTFFTSMVVVIDIATEKKKGELIGNGQRERGGEGLIEGLGGGFKGD
jgi:hypothetical protein